MGGRTFRDGGCGKGSVAIWGDRKRYEDNYDRIFRKKKPVEEEEVKEGEDKRENVSDEQ